MEGGRTSCLLGELLAADEPLLLLLDQLKRRLVEIMLEAGQVDILPCRQGRAEVHAGRDWCAAGCCRRSEMIERATARVGAR